MSRILAEHGEEGETSRGVRRSDEVIRRICRDIGVQSMAGNLGPWVAGEEPAVQVRTDFRATAVWRP